MTQDVASRQIIASQTQAIPPRPSLRIVAFPDVEQGESSFEELALTPQQRSDVVFLGREILRQERDALSTLVDLLDESFSLAVETLLHCSGNVIVTGMGKAGLVGRKISATLSSTGTRSFFLHPGEAAHGDLGMIGPDDLILVLSHSGETEEIIRLLPSIMESNCRLMAITGHAESTLGHAADLVLSLGSLIEADALHLAPSTSTTAMIALGDALALTVSQIRGFKDEDFARFHPGGSLGRQLSHVDDHMRDISECRVCSQDKTVREIFVETHVPGRRSGAILLVDQDGRLAGIFTDSDLAKLFEKRDNELLDAPIWCIMTKSPKFVLKGTRMTEAIAVMSSRKISELPVLDEKCIPVGLLDITDLFSFFPK